MNHTYLVLLGALFVGEASADDLQKHLLTDDEIAARCEASIKGKVNLVIDTEGKTITKCEQTYFTMRSIAQSYVENESAALGNLKNTAANCESSATQAGCLEAARALASRAQQGHETLAGVAEQGQVKLDEVSPPEQTQ